MFSQPPGDRTPPLAAFAGSLRFLRITWMLWLASHLWIFAFPLLVLVLVSSPEPDTSVLVQCGDPEIVLRADPWLWFPHHGHVAFVFAALAALAPPALHHLLSRRAHSPFRLRRAAETSTHDYRSPPPWVVEASLPAARRLVTLYAGRMGLALALSLLTLLHTAAYPALSSCCYCTVCERGLPYGPMAAEGLVFAAFLFAVTLYHAPLPSRVLGSPPRIPAGRS